MPGRRPAVALVAALVLGGAVPAHASLLGGSGTLGTITAPVTTAVTTVTSPIVTPITQVVEPVTQVVAPVIGDVPVVQTITGTLDTATGGAVSGATGTVGGVVDGAGSTDVTKTIETLLGGATGGGTTGGGTTGAGATGGATGTGATGLPAALPAGTITTLLSFLGAETLRTYGQDSANGVVVDGRAPRVTVTPLSKLRSTGRDGRLKLRIAVDEPGVVALAGTLRPGKARKGHRVSRRPIHFPTALLVYRRAGALRVTVQLSRSAQRALAAARDGRLSVQMLAVDVARNQARSAAKRHLAR